MPIEIRACVVCEQARPELHGKYSLLGFYGLAPFVAVAISNFQLPVTLCFVFMGVPAHGRMEARIRVLDPDGTIVPGDTPAAGPTVIPPDRPLSNYIMQFQGRAPRPGNYTVVLTVNGEDVHTASFRLAEAQRPA